MKAAAAILLIVAFAPLAWARQTPPPALTRATRSVVSLATHLLEQRGSVTLRWYSMLGGSLWVVRDSADRVVEEWDYLATDSWRERRSGRVIQKTGNAWHFDNGDILRFRGDDAEIRDSSGLNATLIYNVP